MFDDIYNSYPRIAGQLSAENQRFVDNLPSDYREFLLEHNGGFVYDFRYTFMTGVPFKTDEVDNPSRDDSPVEFFGIPTTEADGEWPADLLECIATHRSEEFLPHDVIAIARCVQNSLVCISLRSEDRGRIYYWDWYWRYPWCYHFFDARIASAKGRFDDPSSILDNPHHAQYQAIFDALNFATLVEVAPNFSEWFLRCQDRRDSS
jgi:SMI1/KNR4 family protein SUKH-1